MPAGESVLHWLIYPLVGIPVGFLAGLLGIGGGAVIVPVLALVFAGLGFDSTHIMQMAIGTSLACIIMGNASSAREHHRHNAVDWSAFKQIMPGIIAGSLAASALAHFAPTKVLKLIFVGFMCVMAAQQILNIKAKPSTSPPGTFANVSVGGIIGIISGLVGIGGAIMTIAYLTYARMPMHRALGTASALGVPIAIAGTAGYIAAGLTVPTLPAGAIGYVYLPAWIGIAVTSVLLAPVGARLAHRLPVATLKKVFVLFLLALAIRMLWAA